MSVSQVLTARVPQGGHFTPIATVYDSAGAVIDLTGGGISVVLRCKRRSDTVITRTQGVGGETSYPASGTDGRIQFLFSPTDTLAMTAGDYAMELVYTNTTPNPDNKEIAAVGTLTIYTPTTGTI